MRGDELGDFQTPPALVDRLLDLIPHRPWARVLEPTCGVGNFMRAAATRFPTAEVVGIELQPAHAEAARRYGRVLQANVFDTDLAVAPGWRRPDGPLLVIGNPPWVTNSALASAGAANRPDRQNHAGARGIDAMTGSSNFDLAESVWLKVLGEHVDGESVVVAFVCKVQVARRVLERCAAEETPVIGAGLWHVDAMRWFGANVGACWFVVELGSGPTDYSAAVFADLDAAEPSSRLGVVDGRMVADLDAYTRSAHLDGSSPLPWRQGVKHDCSKVMELRITPHGLVNGLGEVVDVEAEQVFPLLKCTDVFRGRVEQPTRAVLLPQRALGQDTSRLELEAPRLWAYLRRHSAALDRRRSSIYANRPRFSIFGVGDYTFAPYKVAVSGFHASAEFRVVGPVEGRPVVFDDSTYLLAMQTCEEADEVAAVLATRPVRDLISALVFADAKRPITKALLQRIDLVAAGWSADPKGPHDSGDRLVVSP